MAKSQTHVRALAAEPVQTPSASACSGADALLRAAAECARQHERLGRCLELACSDIELQHIAELTTLSDTHLDAMAVAYEKTATAAPEARNTEWWHAANALWHASREYARRNAGTNHGILRVSSPEIRRKGCFIASSCIFYFSLHVFNKVKSQHLPQDLDRNWECRINL